MKWSCLGLLCICTSGSPHLGFVCGQSFLMAQCSSYWLYLRFWSNPLGGQVSTSQLQCYISVGWDDETVSAPFALRIKEHRWTSRPLGLFVCVPFFLTVQWKISHTFTHLCLRLVSSSSSNISTPSLILFVTSGQLDDVDYISFISSEILCNLGVFGLSLPAVDIPSLHLYRSESRKGLRHTYLLSKPGMLKKVDILRRGHIKQIL